MGVQENGFWRNLVVSKVPVYDYLKLRTDHNGDPSGLTQQAELVLPGKVEPTINPAIIVARAFAATMPPDDYLAGREKYLGETLESLTEQLNADEENTFVDVEKIEHRRLMLEAEQAMLKLIIISMA